MDNTKILLSISIVGLLIVSQHVESITQICNSPKCVEEAANILNYVDPTINPCEDFYHFTCGNFLKNFFGNEKFELKRKLKDQQIEMKIKIYQEDILEHDHKMVKIGKKLYQKCLDKSEVNKDLNTVKEVIKSIGGWPVLEGSSWNEGDFDWLNATYKLRRLGYAYSVVLDLNVVQDPDDYYNKYIFKLNGPAKIQSDVSQKDMAKVAVLFGAENEEMASSNLSEAHKLLQKLDQLFRNVYLKFTKQTVGEIQKREDIIDWLEFINNLIGLKNRITKDDYILFPTKQYLTQVIEIISKVSKRTQANYMIWKIIEPLLRFLPSCSISPLICDRTETNKMDEQRTLFCLRQIHSRLITEVPNPIDVIQLRRYLPEQKKKKVEDLVLNIKSKALESVNKVDWVSKEMFKKVNEAKVVVGIPGNYFDDNILDEADIDMPPLQNKTTFFDLLAQVNRNFQSSEYRKVNQFSPESLYGSYIADDVIPSYTYYKLNVIYVPVTASLLLYDENRPEYLNYGMLGTIIGHQLSKALLIHRNSMTSIRECLLFEMKNTTDEFKKYFLLQTTMEAIIAKDISYAAYEEWIKNNREELKLIATDYSPKQLFWISATSTVCHPKGASEFTYTGKDFFGADSKIYSASESLRHHPKFSKDFNCPVNSKMNPSNKCNVL